MELLQAISYRLVIGFSGILFLVWIISVAIQNELISAQYYTLALIYVLVAASTIRWTLYRPLLAQVIWLVGLIFLITIAELFYPVPLILYLYLPLPFMAVILINWQAGIVMEIAILGVFTWLSSIHILPPIISLQNIGIFIVSGLLGIIGWASFEPFFSTTSWTYYYYQQAKEALKDARQKQADLLQTQEDLLTANQELSRLTDRLKALQEIAEEARQAKTAFVANVSHELRAPLNMIIGFSDIIVRSASSYSKRLPPALLADITTIQRNAQHLSRLVDDVLDLSQIEGGRMALTRERSSINEIVKTAIDVVRPLFGSKGLYLKTNTPIELPTVFCDQTRIRQILINLLSNAGRFTQQGGVTLTVELTSTELLFHVTDTGPGISKENQVRLFEPFQQADISLRREHGGSGLGLSISKQFVEMHGGKIWMESGLGVGTIISFTLPVSTLPVTELGSTHPALRWVQQSGIRERRTRPFKADLPKALPSYILVESGTALKHFFNRYTDNVAITSFTELPRAIDELSHSPAQAFIINTPWILTPTDHSQLAEQLSDLPYGTPAIVCWLPGKEDIASELGVIDYIIKPINIETLLSTVQKTGEKVKSILVVDDEESALQMLMRILTFASPGYRVWRATTGEMALEMMRSRKPDLVLLDMVLPDKDGFQVLREKKDDERIRDIPVIIVSAKDPVYELLTTDTLLVKRKNGLSVKEFIDFIKAVSGSLTPHSPSGDPEASGILPG